MYNSQLEVNQGQSKEGKTMYHHCMYMELIIQTTMNDTQVAVMLVGGGATLYGIIQGHLHQSQLCNRLVRTCTEQLLRLTFRHYIHVHR